MPIADLRREYDRSNLRRVDLNPDPMAQFSRWFQESLENNSPGKIPAEANAMTLATASKDGRPAARTVLLKGVDERGFIFFSQYEGPKGRDLEENPQAALVFYWPELERQVCVAGSVSRVSREESEAYFKSRPKGSRLAAWVSRQSEVVRDRQVLEDKFAQLSAQHAEGEIPLPTYWGGYALSPNRIEFWQGRPSRLHDRFRYTKQAAGPWLIERLAP